MGRLQLLEVGSDTSEAEAVCSISCCVCMLPPSGPDSDKTIEETVACWGRVVCVK